MQDWKLVEKAVELFLERFEGTPGRIALMWKEFLNIELPNPTICKTSQLPTGYKPVACK